MAIIIAGATQALGNELQHATDAGSAYKRVEPLLTAEKLRSRFLFGVPMWSFLPDPVSRKRQEYTVEMQLDAIARAVNWVEMHCKVAVQAEKKTRRLPFDRAEYFSLGYFQLPDAPITKVLSLACKPAGDTIGAIYAIDPAWIDNAHLQRGQLNVIPYMPATMVGYIPMQASGQGGAAFLSILGHLGWVPSFWECEYICGFQEGRVPVMVNELIGCIAASNVLSEIGTTNRVGQYSVSLDGAQQSVQTGGVNVYDDRIKKLDEQRDGLARKLKKQFGNALFSGNV